MNAKNENHFDLIIEHLEQIIYWRERFRVYHDLEFLDIIELHEDAVREHLPVRFKDFSITKLCDLYLQAIACLEELRR